MKGRQESETHCSIRFKKVDRVIWSEGMFQSDLGKMAVECFSNLCSNAGKALQHHLSDRCSHTWMCPRQINQVLFRKCNHLKLVQRIFSPGLVALVAHMTAHCCVVGQWKQWGNLPGCLDQRLVLLTLQDLHVHDDDLESYNEIFRKTKLQSDLSVYWVVAPPTKI